MGNIIQQNTLSVLLANISPLIITYFFWILASNFVETAEIGIISTLLSISMILAILSNFSIPTGMKTFLGKSFSEQDWPEFKKISFTSIIFVLFTSVIVLTCFIFLDIIEMVGIEKKFIFIIFAIVLGYNSQQIFTSILVSSLKSNYIVLPTLVSSFIRIPIFFFFLYFFQISEMNVSIAFSAFFILISSTLFVITFNFLKNQRGNFCGNFKNNIKLIILGSLPQWIPQIIATVGSQSSIIVLFILQGPEESALFFIPFALYNLIILTSSSFTQVSHPVLSGITVLKSQENFTNKMLKFNFLIALPLSSIVYFHSSEILSIFGSDFINSSETLSILIYSIPFNVINGAIYYFFYSQSEYRKVFLLGLVSVSTRIILYVILISEYSGIGASLSILIAELLQFIFTIYLIKKIKFSIRYFIFVQISLIPFIFGFVFDLFNFGIIAIFPILIFSALFYIKLGFLDENEIKDMFKLISNGNKNYDVKLIHILKQLKIIKFKKI